MLVFAKTISQPPYLVIKPRIRLFRMIKNHFQAESEGEEGKVIYFNSSLAHKQT